MKKLIIPIISLVAILCGVGILNLSMSQAEKRAEVENAKDESSVVEEKTEDEEDYSEVKCDMGKIKYDLIEESVPNGHIDFETAVKKACLHVKKLAGEDVSDTIISVHQENEYMDEEDEYLRRIYFNIHFDYSEDESDDKYIVKVDAITGQIRGYMYYQNEGVTDQECIDNNIIIDGYKESELGYGIDDYEDNVGEVGKFWNTCVLQNASKYNDIAKDFAENTLKLEEVYEFFGHSTAVASRTNGDRYYYLVHCKSTDMEVVQMTIDQMTGEVTEYIYVD